MAQREMSYDLDGVFATRNQGQLISTVAQQSRTIRTPGLSAVSLASLGDAPKPSADTIKLPVIGEVKTSHAVLGALAVVGAFYYWQKHY